MGLILTESRTAPASESFLAYLRALGSKWGAIRTGRGWGRWILSEHDQALGDRKVLILNKRYLTALDPMIFFFIS